jgi:acetoin:2,6-dichlorophenolindophenol oxidoreductase subunit alpha
VRSTADMAPNSAAARPSQSQLERMYEVIRTVMLCDERAKAEVRAGRMQAAFYPVRGLEGVCAALGAVLRPSDHLVSTYRNLGDVVAKGAPLRAVIAELYGRADGVAKGKGGPMHLHAPDVGLMATTGIVGSGLPIAVGLAVAAQLDGDGRVVAVTFGDGATSIGAYHEAMNLAALWKLPIVFVCQNNMWAEHTPIAEYAPDTDLARRAAAYAMAARAVDGFDPVAAWAAFDDAVGSARAGDGPVFLECRTYRLTGHSSTADYSYVPKDELDRALGRDPSVGFGRLLVDEGLVAAARLAELDEAAAAAVDDAFSFAWACAPPAEDEVARDVLSDERLLPCR